MRECIRFSSAILTVDLKALLGSIYLNLKILWMKIISTYLLDFRVSVFLLQINL